uniref:Prefoldin subunit 2 n=1 Tax=Strombidium inclinatum TaxID=197538 RepID=A0A7S3N328_9SPIT|mmetsp:Transcript_5596/g.8827  ORF Transcript_5596/g.8827 Transcript_5596/m.8827 type:complete len:109 (+) Transcript_5596:139-465(+)
MVELEDERKENELVLESITKLEDSRKCWRLINGVLVEKTKLEVVPEMRGVINNLNAVVKQITETLTAVREEIKNLEGAYNYIMKQAKTTAQAQQAPDAKGAAKGGVLV